MTPVTSDIEELPTSTPPYPDLPSFSFPFTAVAYTALGTELSDFRYGEMAIKDAKIHVTGRKALPAGRRRLIYTLSGLGFIPGIALAYLWMERMPWIREWMSIEAADVLAITAQDDYRLIAIVHNTPDPAGAPQRRTLTFQASKAQYRAIYDCLSANFPAAIRQAPLRASLSSGAGYALIGIGFWILAYLLLTIR